MNTLAQPISLPCGESISNRFCKAAMTEGLADADDNPTERHDTLYGRWSDGGAGLLLTGNMMVDRRYLERPGNVVLDQHTNLDKLSAMAQAATRNGNHCWTQISHPGRQCARTTSGKPVAPSRVKMRGMLGFFAPPRELTVDEIREAIQSYARAAAMSKRAGFTGVQIHSAHGYLCSQFLSPYVNQRTDEWGGTLIKRARFLLEVYGAVRAAVGPSFPVAVKLNSSDFQKGGFSNEDSAQVARWMCQRGIDLIEVSGGTYESWVMTDDDEGKKKAESTLRREAYFLEYTKLIREASQGVPLLLTGGFRTVSFMDEVVAGGDIDLVGIARPFCVVPDLPKRALSGELLELPAYEKNLQLGRGWFGPASSSANIRTLNNQAEVAWFYRNIIALSEGREPDTELGIWRALIDHLSDDFRLSRGRTFRRQPMALPASTGRAA